MNTDLFPRTPVLQGDNAEAWRSNLRAYFHATFDRYEQLFEVLTSDAAYYQKPIPLRHPLIFYFGHTATFFINKLVLAGLVEQRINAKFESMFAIGVDEMSWDDLNDARYDWPRVEEVRGVRVDPRAGRWELAGAAALPIVPGRVVTLDGKAVRVGAVEHRLHEVALRTVVFEERATDPANRLMAAIESIVRRTVRQVDYLALYPGRVVAQDGDGGPLDVELDEPRFALPRAIPYRTLAGVAVTVPAGARVLVGFEGGDPARPYAGLWELGDVTRLVIGGGTQGAARHGDAVSASTAFDAWVQSVSIATGVTPPVGELGAISTSSDVVRLP